MKRNLILILFSWMVTGSVAAFAVETPFPPAWMDQAKYKHKSESTMFHDRHSIFYLGAHIGFKNGFGTDFSYCKKIRDFFCVGINVFSGTLQSAHLVRNPIGNIGSATFPTTEDQPNTSEYTQLLANPESWTAIVPQIGFAANSPILALLDPRWSDSAWIGVGRAYLGGFSGWAVSFEPSINRTFALNGNWGMSLKARYTFGWLSPKNDTVGTIPFDWYNISTGIYYIW
jgi:hypothetical protein